MPNIRLGEDGVWLGYGYLKLKGRFHVHRDPRRRVDWLVNGGVRIPVYSRNGRAYVGLWGLELPFDPMLNLPWMKEDIGLRASTGRPS